MLYTISEEDYLSHYGRKGMKWYQHIYGDQTGIKPVRKQRKLINKSAKAYDKQNKAYWKALSNEYDLREAYETYKKTGSKESKKQFDSCLKKSRSLAENLVKSTRVLNQRYTKLGSSLGEKGKERLKQMYDNSVYMVGNLGRRVWEDSYDADQDGVRKNKRN